MVSQDRESIILEVRLHFPDAPHDGEALLFSGGVVFHCCVQSSTGVPEALFSFASFLGEDRSQPVLTSIGL